MQVREDVYPDDEALVRVQQEVWGHRRPVADVERMRPLRRTNSPKGLQDGQGDAVKLMGQARVQDNRRIPCGLF
jgi:hypothetical protein